MTIRGLIFDFDGLILDTEMPYCEAWTQSFARYGFLFTVEDYKKAIGTGPSAYDMAEHLKQLTNGVVDPLTIRNETRVKVKELILRQPMLPGVQNFLESGQKMGLPMAVASSSEREWVEGYLSHLNIRHFFSAVCTADDVKRVKPNPELFLLAAGKIGLAPNEVIVFEDSPNGIAAAKAANMFCVAIPNPITISMDLSQADLVVESFNKINLVNLLKSNKQI